MTRARSAAIFLSHGSPMVAVQHEDRYAADLRAFAGSIPRPEGIVIVSAHWRTPERVEVTATSKPETIHDFGGFPKELYSIRYGCPGSPELAQRCVTSLESAGTPALLNGRQGLDHGAWIPLAIMFPDASIPVVQVALPASGGPQAVLKMGQALAALRDEGILLVGSGGMVHNLRKLRWDAKDSATAPWIGGFTDWVHERIARHDVPELLLYESKAPLANDAHPTDEHFLPLFFALGARGEADRFQSIHEGVQYSTLSMASFGWL